MDPILCCEVGEWEKIDKIYNHDESNYVIMTKYRFTLHHLLLHNNTDNIKHLVFNTFLE